MMKGSFSETTPGMKLLLTGFLVIMCFLVVFLLGSLAAIIFFDFDLFTQSQAFDLESEAGIGIMKFFQVLYSIGLLVIPSFLLAYLFGSNTLNYLNLNRVIATKKYLLGTLLILCALPLINLMAEFNSQLSLPDFLSGIEDWMRDAENKAEVMTEMFLKMDSMGDLFINLFVIALIPALGEELLFRGIIQKLFADWTRNIHWGIILSAILFSALHMQFFGFLPRMMMGILFGYLLIWSKNLWLPITVHFINNGIAVIGYFLVGKGVVSEDIENIGSSQSLWGISIFSLFLTGYLIFLFHRSREK